MEFAYSESTHRPSRFNGRFVGEGVNVRVGNGVKVRVGEKVRVGLRVGVSASTVRVAVAGSDSVAVGAGEVGVDVGGADGVKSRLERSANSTASTKKIGMAYLRRMEGRDHERGGVTTGGSPVYPSAVKRLLKLAA